MVEGEVALNDAFVDPGVVAFTAGAGEALEGGVGADFPGEVLKALPRLPAPKLLNSPQEPLIYLQ